MGEGAEARCCWFGFYAGHRGAAAVISGEASLETAGRPASFSFREGEEVFEQYVRDIITNIYRILLELLHDVRHGALVYALEPVEVVGLAVACAFFCVVAAMALARRAVVWRRAGRFRTLLPYPRPSARCDPRRPSSA